MLNKNSKQESCSLATTISEHRILSLFLSLILVFISPQSFSRIDTIAITGDPIPDGDGEINRISFNPSINNSGKIIFCTSLSNTSNGSNNDSAIFRYEENGSLTEVVREGLPASGSLVKVGDLDIFCSPSINDSGDIAFKTGFADASSEKDGVIFKTSNSIIYEVAHSGITTPDNSHIFYEIDQPTINNNGVVVFSARISPSVMGTVYPIPGDNGIYKYENNSIHPVAIKQQIPPDGDGYFGRIASEIKSYTTFSINPVINNLDEIAFWGHLQGTNAGTQGIYTYNPNEGLSSIVRTKQDSPDDNGIFWDLVNINSISAYKHIAINNTSQIAFLAETYDRNLDVSFLTGIFFHNGESLSTIIRKGMTAPDENGRYSYISSNLALNDSGQVAFYASLSDTLYGADDNDGIFIWNGIETTQIARKGDSIPGGNQGNIYGLGSLNINSKGQVAFNASISDKFGGFAGGRGLFIWDGTKIKTVVREGDSIDNNHIVQLYHVTEHNQRKSFNDNGQMVFRARLNNGKEGIFLYSPDDSTVSTPDITPDQDQSVEDSEAISDTSAITTQPINEGGGIVSIWLLLFGSIIPIIRKL